MTEPLHRTDPLAAFQRERGRLFGVAYRMLSSVSEAEDVLQDAWLRWQAVDPATVENPSAFLMRTVTRLCIDNLGAARNRLTDYVGPWLPEPLIQDRSESPESLRELADDLSTAFLLLLERLNPVERAVFLLRESFDFSHKEIAETIGKTEENCRQIDRRARQKLSGVARPRPADPEEHDRLLYGFLQASRQGDMQGMLNLLAKDAVCISDGGGKTHAAKISLHGAERVAKFISGLQAKAQVPFEVRMAQVNGRTGFITYVEGRIANVGTMRIEDGLIREIFIQVNPDKLP
ncbi:MAG TPA: RNA polymerase sigma-70 factor [Thermoanaerobaculia bacterium]|nr:RNA polymerase sigma-70 factor [Thermoanaerobaculia bacterium]